MLANLIDDIVAEQQFGQHQRRLERDVQPIGLDGQLLVYLHVLQLVAVATQLDEIVKDVDTILLRLFGVVRNGHRLGALRQIGHARTHRLLGQIGRPGGVVLLFDHCLRHHHVQRAARREIGFRRQIGRRVVGRVAVLALLGALAAFALGQRRTNDARISRRRILDDVRVHLVVDLQRTMKAARLASLRDGALFGGHQQIGLGIIAFGAQHVLANKAVQQIL